MSDFENSETVTFTTLERVLSVTTGSVSNIEPDSATLEGSLDEMEGFSTADCSFEYREEGESSWLESDSEERSSTGSFDADIDDLDYETEYEYRAKATGYYGDDGEREALGDTETFTSGDEPLPEWQTVTAGEGTDEESEIYVYEADDPGPVTMGINIHGSERAGIEALEEIKDEWTYPISSGTLIVWPAPCPSAEENETLTCNGEDLNEAFDLDDGPQTTVAETIEDELLEWDVEYLVDMHTRSTLFEDGGEAHAVFPSDDSVTRPISNEVIDNINDEYGFSGDQAWQVGNTVDESGAETDGMLVTYAWEEYDIHGQIPITWSSRNLSEQIDQHQRALAVTLDEAGYDLGDDAAALVD